MRPVLIASLCLWISACSTLLEVRVFNATGSAINVCSLSSPRVKCVDVADAESSVLTWGTGKFAIKVAGCTRLYQAPVPTESIEAFRARLNDPVNAAIDGSFRIGLVRNGEIPDLALTSVQPAGYPLEAYEVDLSCK